MAGRGPAPTPTPILEARGSWRAKARKGEPHLPVKAPSCPAWLSKEGKAEWRRSVKALKDMGVLAEADRSILVAHCEAWAEFVLLVWQIGEMAKRPADVWTAYGLMIQAGIIGTKNKAADRYMKTGAQLGFSPSARTRLVSVAALEEKTGPTIRDFKLA